MAAPLCSVTLSHSLIIVHNDLRDLGAGSRSGRVERAVAVALYKSAAHCPSHGIKRPLAHLFPIGKLIKARVNCRLIIIAPQKNFPFP